MKGVAELLRDMHEAGVITDYAIFGAVAQMRYTESVATMDADVLIGIPKGSSLDVLKPVHDYCRSKGYREKGEAIQVGEWPVQFIPAFNTLTEEAMREAHRSMIEGVPIRVVRADHLAVIALDTGRPKDFARILSLLESGAVARLQIESLAGKHGLSAAWNRFESRFLE